MQDRAKRNPKIEFIWDSVVVEILGEKTVSGVTLKNVKTGALTKLPCSGVFVAIGHRPNTELVEGQLKLDAAGYLITDERGRTEVPGVFAAGDVMDTRYRQAITAAGAGCKAALEAERFLADQESAT